MTTSELSGLIGWWPLDDGQDGRLSDCLGRSGGVVTGAVPCIHSQSDRLGPKRSLYFPRGAYAAIPDAPNVGTGDFSVCLWAKTSGYSGDTEVLLDKRMENFGPVRGWCVFLYQRKLGFQISDGSETNFLLDSFRWQSDSNWHHLAITIDRDQTDGGRWYMDGQAVGKPFAVSGRDGSLSNQFPLTLGRRSDAGGGYFGGDLSDVRLYQRVLTAEEIYQVHGSISADEPAFRILVTLPPVVSSAALQVKDSEPLPLPDGVPMRATRLEPEGEAPPEIAQPEQVDTRAALKLERLEQVRQKILTSLSAEALDLSWKALTHLLPEIGQLKNLQSLELKQNWLTHLPPEIGQLKNLKKLGLWNNKLTHLPPEIGQLQNLQSLYLQDNKLTHLPPEIGQLKNLQSLDIRGNSIQDFSPLSNHPNPNLRLYVAATIRGLVSLSRQYWTHSNQWKAEWLLTEPNASIRRMLLDRIGYDRICQELQSIELDSWREYTLLKIAAEVDVEPIHLLKMTCPSTAHIHVLRVPPDLNSARDAIRWTNWDVDPEAFAVET